MKHEAQEKIAFRTAVMTMSDKGSRGEREDLSGPAIAEMVTAYGYRVVETLIIPDNQKIIEAELIRLADSGQVDLILTTGGTGFSPRDVTPEATMAVMTRNAPGIAEAMRALSMKYTKRAMLSRAASVIRGNTLIINMPGSPKAVRECLEEILDSVDHGLRIMTAKDSECARS
ncbi:MAG: MogA/MoaB family molybdenum cofactor biosynthesis protein [Lachnospiraceae bacterium]|nr:MogA/MoaB family molybdenum cofactor biosynthesis protein [Lachnospiraceae bacterium]